MIEVFILMVSSASFVKRIALFRYLNASLTKLQWSDDKRHGSFDHLHRSYDVYLNGSYWVVLPFKHDQSSEHIPWGSIFTREILKRSRTCGGWYSILFSSRFRNAIVSLSSPMQVEVVAIMLLWILREVHVATHRHRTRKPTHCSFWMFLTNETAYENRFHV